MLRRVAAGMSACALIVLVAVVPGPAPVSASGMCTGWGNEYQPPPTIRVYRTIGPAAGTVQAVPFRAYVETVLTGEYGSSTPPETLRAGAVAAKQYAWYQAMHWRGGRAPSGDCFDVQDNPIDQLYLPERYHASDQDQQAVASTWQISLRKYGQFFMTGYRGGGDVPCGANADGWRLYQRSAYRCGRDGMLAVAILHVYYDPGLEIVVPGAHDITGEGVGDVAVLLPGRIAALPGGSPALGAPAPTAPASADPSLPAAPASADPSLPAASIPPVDTIPGVAARIYVGADLAAPGGSDPAIPRGVAIDPATVLGYAAADVTGDRLDDLVVLSREPDGSLRLSVAPATGAGGFASAGTWWTSAGTGFSLPVEDRLQLVTGDFDGDGLVDVAILAGAPAPAASAGGSDTPPGSSTAALYGLRSTGTSFEDPRTWWTGALVGATALAFGADVDGDGRADLVVESDMIDAGSSGSVPPPAPLPSAEPGQSAPPAASPSPDTSAAPATPAASSAPSPTTSAGASPSPTPSAPAASVSPAVPSTAPGTAPGGGMRISVALSREASGLGELQPWLDLPGLAVAQSRTVVADVNRDGRDDLVIDVPLGASGSQFVGAISDGSSFSPVTLWQGARFGWGASKIATADVNGDGRGDVVVLYDARDAGTRLYRFLSTGSTLRLAGRSADPTLPWGAAIPL